MTRAQRLDQAIQCSDQAADAFIDGEYERAADLLWKGSTWAITLSGMLTLQEMSADMRRMADQQRRSA